jgi:hypothetical protein
MIKGAGDGEPKGGGAGPGPGIGGPPHEGGGKDVGNDAPGGWFAQYRAFAGGGLEGA